MTWASIERFHEPFLTYVWLIELERLTASLTKMDEIAYAARKRGESAPGFTQVMIELVILPELLLAPGTSSAHTSAPNPMLSPPGPSRQEVQARIISG